VARYLAEFYKNKGGVFGSLFLVFKIYLSWLFSRARYRNIVHKDTYRLAFDGQPLPHETSSLALMASTVERMPLGFKLFPMARSNLSKFQMFSLEMSERSLPWKLPIACLRNQKGHFMGKMTRLASSMIISEVSGRQLYTLDGELFEAPTGRLAIEVGPVVQFVVV
jgi:diacylglycerol kinase family enzyme